jgi:hypothetical protein
MKQLLFIPLFATLVMPSILFAQNAYPTTTGQLDPAQPTSAKAGELTLEERERIINATEKEEVFAVEDVKVFPTPMLGVTVVSPNGGESWDKSELHTILWSGGSVPFVMDGREEYDPRPFFSRISIDLIRDSDASFVYHIGTADVFQSKFEWKIPSRIGEGNDYRIRISGRNHIPCLYQYQLDNRLEADTYVLPPYPCPLSDSQYSVSDSSDGVFTITGTSVPPTNGIAKLKAQVTQMEIALNELMRQIQSLKALLGNL